MNYDEKARLLARSLLCADNTETRLRRCQRSRHAGRLTRWPADSASASSTCLPRGASYILSVTEGRRPREQTDRSGAGNTRPAGAQDPRLEADERLGDRTASQATVVRRAPGERRITLPRAAQARAGRVDQIRVAAEREQSPRQVLFAHAVRKEAAPGGVRKLG